jgi:arylsulfatase A-like enzyme
VVYDIEPFRGAVRQGEWKLVWKATLPPKVELFNLAQDPSEQTNLADQHPQKVAELQQRIAALAGDAVPPLLVLEAFRASWSVLTATVTLPSEDKALEMEP